MAGAVSNDRKKSAHARNLILDQVIRLFEADPLTLGTEETGLKRELLLRMAPNTLPRLTEVTGEDGGALQVTIVKYALKDGDNAAAPVQSETIPEASS